MNKNEFRLFYGIFNNLGGNVFDSDRFKWVKFNTIQERINFMLISKKLIMETSNPIEGIIRKQLKRGQITVSKKDLSEFVQSVLRLEQNIDSIMKEPESNERGKKIAKELNRLTFARHNFEHFQLGVPLKKLK